MQMKTPESKSKLINSRNKKSKIITKSHRARDASEAKSRPPRLGSEPCSGFELEEIITSRRSRSQELWIGGELKKGRKGEIRKR